MSVTLNSNVGITDEGVVPVEINSSGKRKETAMEDFLKFKKMITPVIIQILFWIGVGVSVVMGLISIVGGANASHGGGAMVLAGILWVFLGPIVVRIYCELLIVVFSINDSLTEVKNLLKTKAN